ncbi:MAG: type VI secretion system lipoprotein TssJ [Candidatus Aminicenantaceae bacterium]
MKKSYLKIVTGARVWSYGGLTVLVLLLVACGGSKQIDLNLQGTQEMNKQQSCVIYVYQLRTDTNFMNASLESFWEQGRESFASDVVEERKYQLVPGETRTDLLTLKEDTVYLGAVGDFNDPDKEGWRQVYSLEKKIPKQLYIVIGYNRLDIQ